MTLIKKTKPKQKRGAILILVMILISVLAFSILYGLQQTNHRNQQAQQQLNRSLLNQAITQELQQAMQLLADDPNLLIDSLDETWNEPGFYDRPDTISVRRSITDLNRYFDLNNIYLRSAPGPDPLTQTTIQNILNQLNIYSTTDFVESLRDAIDPDNQGPREADYYRATDSAYDPPNQWMQTHHTLKQLPAYRAMLNNNPDAPPLETAFTLIPESRNRPYRININTAPQALLQGLLGIQNIGLADKMVQVRRNTPFQSTTALLEQLDDPTKRKVRPMIDVKSSHFLIEIRVSRAFEHASRSVYVVRDADGTVNMLQVGPLI